MKGPVMLKNKLRLTDNQKTIVKIVATRIVVPLTAVILVDVAARKLEKKYDTQN